MRSPAGRALLKNGFLCPLVEDQNHNDEQQLRRVRKSMRRRSGGVSEAGDGNAAERWTKGAGEVEASAIQAKDSVGQLLPRLRLGPDRPPWPGCSSPCRC